MIKPAHPEKAPPAAAPVLRVLALGSGAEPRSPDTSSDPRECAAVSARLCEFAGELLIRGPWFVAWESAAFASTIRMAHLDHRVLDEGGLPVGKPTRHAASLEPEGRLWFVPFSELHEGDGTAEHPGRLHVLQLDLLMESGAREAFEVRYRAIGPLPAPVIRALDGSGEVELSNPSSRPFVAWVRPVESGAVAPDAFARWDIARRVWIQRPGPFGMADKPGKPEESFERSTLRTAAMLDAWTSGTWTRLELPAGAKARARWGFRPQSDPRPGLPLAVARVLTWWELPGGTLGFRSHSDTFVESSFAEGVRIQGKLGLEVRQAHPFQSIGEASVLPSAEIPLDLAVPL